jgi:hypothetical protein
MNDLLALIGLTLLGLGLILMAHHHQLNAFPAGIIVYLFGILESAFLNGDMIPTWIGLAGFTVLGSLGVLQELKRKETMKT